MRSLPVLAFVLLSSLAHAQQEPGAALFTALAAHDTPALKALLAAGVSPTLQDATGHAAINLAAQNGDLDDLALFLAASAPIDNLDRFGPPLWYAVTFGQSDTVSYLLAHGARVDARNHMDQTPLIWAVRAGRTDMVTLLLRAGADVNAVDRTKDSLLHIAALANDHDLLPLLVKAGAHAASLQEEMMAAASYGDAIRIRELVAAGAPIDFDGGRGETPLMAAAAKGQTVAVRALLAAGASVSALDTSHQTALFYALKSAHRSTVDQLLTAGSDPGIKNGGGVTTLMQLASYFDDPDLALYLIAAGVDPNAVTGNGSRFTALHQAAAMGRPRVLKVLIDAGVDLNLQTVLEGDSALIDAARSGQTECVALLLKAGADPTLRDHRDPHTGSPNNSGAPGRTALDWANDYHHPDAAALLEARTH